MSFKRQDNHKKKSVPDSWRRPTGGHSRARLEKKGAVPLPKAGYRTPKSERGKHPSGFEEVLVHNVSELEQLDDGEAARIASKVGGKKKEQIIEKADEEEIKVLNRGDY
ncbi:50S ribosomal protein L32e [Candidatus Nanosalina sp. VS9-1]|uniref:50S ribosomal protein L32e n=1 Tax=Candidatus Nanosalina sp. VS9-1 TaxID=3388566 RepID=UPI0039DFE49D